MSARRGFAPILIVIAVVAFAGIGAGIFFINRFTPPPINDHVGYQYESPATQTSASPTIPTTNETANWKTYTNQVLGFFLNYPPSVTTDFVAFDGGAGGNNILGLKGPNYKQNTDFGSGMAIWASSISGFDTNSAAIADRQSIKQNEAAGFGQNFELTCTTQEAKIGNVIPAIFQTCNNIPAHFVYVQNPKGTTVRLTTLSAGSYQPLIDQILSTFQFTN